MLLSSVGENGTNPKVEVKIVQMLLNDWLGNNRQTLLKVDGIAGPLTIGAIRAFQKAQNIRTDGRVDPAGPTIAGLVRLHLGAIRSAVANTRYGRELLSTSRPFKEIVPNTLPSAGSPELDYIAGLRATLAK
jgi:peptidoglycan hydrolase-like protein with peptidoglycan-binding domain